MCRSTAIPRDQVLSRLAALQAAPAAELKAQWRALFGKEPPPFNRPYLVSRLSYRVQELAYGGLKPETRARLEALGEQVDGGNVVLRAAETTQPHTAPTESLEASLPQRRPGGGLRNAATAVLGAWEARSDDPSALEAAIASLQSALIGKPVRPAREPGAPRAPRQGTKQEQVLALLRRPEGVEGQAAMARALNERGVPTPQGWGAWTHTTVARVMARSGCA